MDAVVSSTRLTLRARQAIHRDALAFVAERYGLDAARSEALAAIPVRWKRARGSSAFYLRAAHGFDGPHILVRVPGGARVRWHTYRRARARFATPPGGIDLDVPTFAGAVLVHELTHALQHGVAGEPRRRYSEVETTENELEFVRRREPEAYARLVREGEARLARLGIGNVTVRQADGRDGWPEQDPFDRIVLACAVPEVPDLLLSQVRQGGRLVAPVVRGNDRAIVSVTLGAGVLRTPSFQHVPAMTEGRAAVL